ncbi:MAG TPA: ABC transporter ATP-binding protein [Rhodospirillales bacterium]|nr:ABC transporter ATP-binding protein [Rhodospirillales bacterium]
MSETPLLELSGITKRFPGVIANDGVGFAIAPGEVHALLGENGAGKSTLVKMIYGVMRPDDGSMTFEGSPYAPAKPSDARAQGVGMVFQHFSLFEALTVANNIALGMNKEAVSDDLDQQIIDVSNSYGLPLDPTRYVGSLSVGERQRIEIIRCLLQNPKLLIMDEPTSVLTPQEVEILFETLTKLSSEGCSILYISHKLEEIRALCDKATVLRGGKVVDSCDPRQETAKSLAEMMIGTALAMPVPTDSEMGEARLVVKGLSMASDDPFGVDLHDISVTVHAGEILGIAGVAGNGQVELMEVLIGERTTDAHIITIDGAAIGGEGPTERRGRGMCSVPEERLGHGAVPEMSLWENTILSARTRKGMMSNGILDLSIAHSFADEIVDKFNVKTAGIEHNAASLSGGNLQKFIVGREILQTPTVLIILQPTWGVDAAAAADIHRALQELARGGTAILVISQDLDELMAISTRFAVIAEGRLSKPQQTGSLSIEEIGLLMGGIHHGGEREASA